MPDDTTFRELPLDQITDGLVETRFNLDDPSIGALAASIQKLGLLQPLVVVEGSGLYRVVAGRRRLRALRKLGRKKAACHVVSLEATEEQAATFAENFHRLDLNPLEEAVAVQELLTASGLTQEKLGERLQTTRTWVGHRLALLQLPDVLQTAVVHRDVSPSIALELNRIKSPGDLNYYLSLVISNGATLNIVRDWVRGFLHAQQLQTQEKGAETEPYQPPETTVAQAPHCHVCHLSGPHAPLRIVYLCWECWKTLEDRAVPKKA